MNEFHDSRSLELGKYNKNNSNINQGYLKPQFNDYEDRKVESDLTAKEKKFLEIYPKMDLDKIRNLNQKNDYDNYSTRINQATIMMADKPNSSIYKKINSNNSNIFHNEVFI